MNENKGWVKLHRELMDKAIWKNSTPEQKTILITLLMMVNHATVSWEFNGKQFQCKPGQCVTSLNHIIAKCGKGISEQNVKTAIKRFEKLGFLTNESTKTGRLITINNWGIYQDDKNKTNKGTNNDVTETSQSFNQAPTPNKNDKNDKNGKNDNTASPCSDDVLEVMEHLNTATGRHFPVSDNRIVAPISKLLEEYSVDDLKLVVDAKVTEWLHSEKMSPYLRPETLFGRKFREYLDSARTAYSMADGKWMNRIFNSAYQQKPYEQLSSKDQARCSKEYYEIMLNTNILDLLRNREYYINHIR